MLDGNAIYCTESGQFPGMVGYGMSNNHSRRPLSPNPYFVFLCECPVEFLAVDGWLSVIFFLTAHMLSFLRRYIQAQRDHTLDRLVLVTQYEFICIEMEVMNIMSGAAFSVSAVVDTPPGLLRFFVFTSTPNTYHL